jgi:hypothetical protein
MDLSQQILSDAIVWLKYAKYIPELKRRENWEEICDRNAEMHIKNHPTLEKEIRYVYDEYVKPRKVLPSMRSMQFAGKPIDLNNARIFNCAYAPVDHPFIFAEAMFLLLGGCFKEGTLVITKNGNKPIEDITINDKILTYKEDTSTFVWVHPTWAGETPTKNKQKVKITINGQDPIYTTADHKFLTENRGWVEAIELTPDDKIISTEPVEPTPSPSRKNLELLSPAQYEENLLEHGIIKW